MTISVRRVAVWAVVLAAVVWVKTTFDRLRVQERELPKVAGQLRGVGSLGDELARYRKFDLDAYNRTWMSACASKRIPTEGTASEYRDDLTRLAQRIGEYESVGHLKVFAPDDERVARIHVLQKWLAEEGAGSRDWDCDDRDFLNRVETLDEVVGSVETCLLAVSDVDPRGVLYDPVGPVAACDQMLTAALPGEKTIAKASKRTDTDRRDAPAGTTETLASATDGDTIARTSTNDKAIVVSPDGWRMVFVVQRGARQVVVIDGNESGPWDDVKLERPGVVFSADSRHVAFVAKRGGKEVVVVDGRAGEPYDAVNDLRLSPLRNRFAYVARRDKSWHVVVDGDEQPGPAQYRSAITFSPDGRRVAWVETTEDGFCMVVDGEHGRSYRAVSIPVFSPDSRRLAYSAMRGAENVVVSDEQVWDAGGSVSDNVWFSPDSRRVAWTASPAGRRMMMIDGEPQGEFESVGKVIFSPDSRRAAFYGRNGREWFVTVDARRYGPYFDVSQTGVRFSADSRHVGWAARATGGWQLVFDGKAGPLWRGVAAGSPVFSDEGGRAGWVAQSDREVHAVIDGQPSAPWRFVEGNVVFSPDGSRSAYVALDDKYHVVIDGKPGPQYERIVAPPVFSPDSRHVAFIVQEGGERRVVYDGVAQLGFPELDEKTLAFSPDSAHLVYAAWDDGWRLVVDGVPARDGFEGFVQAAALTFEPDGGVRTLANTDGETDVVRYRIELAASRR